MADGSETLDVPAGIEDGNFSTDNDVKILNDGLDESLEEALKRDKPPPKDKEEPEKAEETEEEEKPEEKEEKPAPKVLGPPIFKDIEKKYPDFFKDFPEVRADLAQKREFSKLFASVDAAKEVIDEIGGFRALEASLFQGKTPDGKPGVEHFVASMMKTDIKATERFAAQILPSLFKVNQGLFMKAWLPAARQLVRQMHEDGKASKNVNLERSAIHAAAYLFGKPEIPEEEKIEPEKIDPEKERLDRERAEFAATKYEEFSSSVYDAAERFLDKEILESIPEDEFTPVIREKIAEDIFKKANAIVLEDADHKSKMTNLWNRAVAQNYKGDFKKELVTTYVREMRRYLDGVRRNVLADYRGKKVPKAPETKPKPRIGGGGGGEKKATPTGDKAKFYRENSDMDIIKSA